MIFLDMHNFVRLLGQVQMPGNLRGLRLGASSLPDTPDILGSAEDGGKGRGVLGVGFSGLQGRDAVESTIEYHLHCGGGCGGETLGRGEGGERGKAKRARTRVQSPK